MKSYVAFLERLYCSILKDVANEYPRLITALDRDRTRLQKIVAKQGISFFTIVLPAAGKHFDRCLADSRLTPFCLPGLGQSGNRRAPVPDLFRDLMLRIFDDSGQIRSHVDKHAVRCLRELFYCSKKIRMECSDAAVRKTVADFVEIESDARRPGSYWDNDDHIPYLARKVHLLDGLGDAGSDSLFRDESSYDELLAEGRSIRDALESVQRTADWFAGVVGAVDFTALRPKHGPGAVADLRGGSFKYDFPVWQWQLESLFPFEEFASANTSVWDEAAHALDMSSDMFGRAQYAPGTVSTVPDGVSTTEVPCVLLAVPKTQKGPRLIAKEPTANQWIQQALKRDIELKIAKTPLKHSIDFRCQEKSREAALAASRNGLRATIDLSSASDRLTLWLVERLFRVNPDLLSVWRACRTRYLVNKLDKKQPKLIKLRKFAPAGSALTFPVQSVVYALICIGVLNYVRGRGTDRTSIDTAARQVRVFGDDLIVPVDCVEVLTAVLTYAGLKVNASKTFCTGRFRESCGMDAYAGEDVTPAYVLEPPTETRPESIASVVAASNNFYRRGWFEAAAYLQSTVPDKIAKAIRVVPVGSGAFGWESYTGKMWMAPKRRFSTTLHQWEVSTITFKTKCERDDVQGWGRLLQYYTEAPVPDALFGEYWQGGVNGRPAISLSRRWVPEVILAERDWINWCRESGIS